MTSPRAGTKEATATEPSTPEDRERQEARDDEGGFRFDDPYWDDAFCAWWDPTLRTCC
jgi:hypothetical protein